MSVKNRSARIAVSRSIASNKKRNSTVAIAGAIGALGMQLFPILGSQTHSAQAATFTFDPGLTPATPSGGTGNWDLATADWSNGTTDNLWVDTSVAGNDVAIFAGAAGGVVTMTDNLSALGISLNTTGYSFTGTSTLTLGANGFTLANNVTATVGVALNLGAAQTWSVNTGAQLLVTGAVVNNGFTLSTAGPGTETVTGAISGAGGVSQNGSGTLILSGIDTYTGATTITHGTLELNFADPAAPASNIINNTANSSALALNGNASLVLAGGAVANSQQFNGTALNAGTFGITLNSAGSSLLLSLGALTRATSGGVTNITLPTGAQSASNGVTTTTANTDFTAQGGSNTIVGGFVTVNGNTWAVSAGTGSVAGNITGLATYSSTFTAGTDVDAQPGITTVAAVTINSLRFNSPGAYTLNPGGNLSIASGGILESAGVGNNAVIINSNLSSGSPSGELIIDQYNTLNALTLAGVVSGTSLTQAGAGNVILTGANTYGTTNVETGTLQIGNGGSIGTLGTGTATIAGTLSFDRSDSGLTISNVITGSGVVQQIGTGTVTFVGSNTYTGRTGVNNGTLSLNFNAGGAPITNIISPSSQLSLGGGLLNVIGNSVSTSQTFASTAVSVGQSTVNVGSNNGSTANPTVALNAITQTAGGVVEFIGPATIGASNVAVPATGTITTTTAGGGAVGVLSTSSNGAYATVGAYDWASTDLPAGTAGSSPYTLIGGSQVTGFYTTFATGTADVLAGNADITGSIGTHNTDEPNTIRFNTDNSGGTTLTLNSQVGDNGVLVTPNVGATNITIANNGNAVNALEPTRSGTGRQLIIWQNNTLGVLNITASLNDTSNAGQVLVQAGPGTIFYNPGANNNNHTGQTYLDGGVAEITEDGALGAPATGAAVDLQGGAIVSNRAGSLTLDNSGSNLRPITVNGIGGSVAATNGNTLTIDGAITGAGALSIGYSQLPGTGAGTANLTPLNGGGVVFLTGGASNTYSGGTNVNFGTLRIDGATSSTGSGNVNVNSGAYLIGVGTTSSTVVNNSGGHIDPGDNAIGTLTTGGLTLNAGSILDYAFTATSNDLINVTNTNGLTINSGAGINVDQAGTSNPFDGNGTYDIFSVAGGSTANLANLQVLNPAFRTTYTFGTSGNFVTLTINSSIINAQWNNTGGGNWSLGSNWTGGAVPHVAGDSATFGSNPPGITAPSTVTLDTSETVGSVIFNNANSYTIAQGGSSVLTLDSGANAASSIADNGGTHTVGVPITLNNANTTFSAANPLDLLVISGALTGSSTLTINPSPGNGLGTVALAANNSGFSGIPMINSGTLQVGNGGTAGTLGTYTGTITDNGTLAYDRSDSLTTGNVIAGSGVLQQSGSGTLTIANATNTNSGGVSITNGSFQLGVAGALGSAQAVSIASPGKLDVNGFNTTILSLSGNGFIDNTNAATATVSIGTAGSTNSNTFGGTIENTVGTVALVKLGTGVLFLNGPSTYTGGTTITSGVIKAGNNTALGAGTVAVNSGLGLQLANGVNIANPITDNAGNNEFEDVPDANASATISGNITAVGNFRMGTSQTTSTLTLTGTDTGAGTSIITRGNVVVAGNGSLACPNNLVIGRISHTATLNLTVQDNAVVTATGVDLGGLNGSSDDAGSTTLGSLSGSVNVLLTGNATLNTGAAALVIDNDSVSSAVTNLSLSGHSTLKTANITMVDTGSVGQLFLNGGTLVANASDPAAGQFLPNYSANLQNSGGFGVFVQSGGGTVNNNGNSITIAESIQDGGGGNADQLTFTGTGTTVLANANGYNGNTTLSSGTLMAANASGSATGNGNVILNGGTLASASPSVIATLAADTTFPVTAGNGFISGNVIAGSAAHTIAPGGIGTIGTLSVGGLTTNNFTTLNFDLGTGAGPVITNGDELLLGSGTVSIGSGTQITVGGTPVLNDDYRIIGAAPGGSIAGVNPNNFVLPSGYSIADNTVDPGWIDLVVNSVGPANLTWNNAGSDNLWNATSSNWNNGAANTTYSDGALVTFNDNNPSSTAANYAVTLNTTVSPASVTVNNSNGNYVIGGTGSIAGTTALSKSGTGNLTLNTVNTYTGGTNVSAGTLVAGVTGALPSGAVSITGGTLQLAPSTGLATISSLAISGTGTFDISNNHVIINYGSPANDPIASIVALLNSGYNGGAWNGPGGITSSAIASNPGYGVGYADAADVGNPAGLASGTIEVKFTLLGDADLNGTVNGIDFGILAANFNKGVSRWDQGDFNYDNIVNGVDFGSLAANFNKGASAASGGATAADFAALDAFAAANGLLADVPEPASLGLLTLGAVGILARRRRRTNA